MYTVNIETLEAVVTPDGFLESAWQGICDFCQGFADGLKGK